LLFAVNSLYYQYDKGASFCLHDVSLSFNTSDVIGLAGANGSGKTTLIRIILRQLVEYTGSYTIDGRKVSDISADLCSQYQLGYSPDIPVLDETLTGFEILRLVALLRDIPANEFDEEFLLLCDFLQMGEWLKTQQCREYSHGMRKKLSIALAFLGNRRFVILDEPLNGLDPVALFGLQQLVTHKKKCGTGTLISSHILDFIEKNADTVALMKDGALIYSGAMDRLFHQYAGHKLDEIYFKLFMKNKEQ